MLFLIILHKRKHVQSQKSHQIKKIKNKKKKSGGSLSKFVVGNNHIYNQMNQNCYCQMSILSLKEKIVLVISDP